MILRIIGLDYGDSRIGVSVSDLLGITAQPVTVLWGKDWNDQINKISDIAKEKGAESFVIGLPRNMNGTIGERAEKTRLFIEKLSEKTKMPVIEWDERLSTKYAHRTLEEGNVKCKNRKGILDKIAAVYILQGYLDSLERKL